MIQCFSDIETAFAYLLEWSDAVVDYYEQFPLLPLEETLVLAERIGARIPVDDGEPRGVHPRFHGHLREGRSRP